MSNGPHKKKQSSSRHSAQRLEAASKGSALAQKKGRRTQGKAISRARLADMTAELDGQFAKTMYTDAQLSQAGQGSSWPLAHSSEDLVKDLAEVLDAL